ncbi:MAG TPA: aspartate kinase [Bacteroidia bacterium]|nr:aspartate kinase [Bacteroidia bacterium]
MQVFKFGGASVKDASSIKNIKSILSRYTADSLVVVVSAMGKTTNALEKVVNAHFNNDDNATQLLNEVKLFHDEIIANLFPVNHPVIIEVNNFFVEAEWMLEEKPRSYNFLYDQIVSIGELVSTKIISQYLLLQQMDNTWIDARGIILTDNNYRNANIDWLQTETIIVETVTSQLKKKNIVITQGFIGGTSENYTTTLGREGSDYTAAIIAYCMKAHSVTIWKDVPGVLNADPRFFDDTQKLEQISYLDAIEMTYYGATVIHPKTIKPLENRGIPLYVKSFLQPEGAGTIIGKDLNTKPFVPNLIVKTNQVLISISATDFSFIAEDNLSAIFNIFATQGIKINLMQNSAISFSVCLDNDAIALPTLLDALKQHFKVRYNDNLTLYTIRHYNQFTLDGLLKGKTLILEQRSRNTAQIITRPN